MRILFISSAYYPATKMGGPLHSVRALAETLVARGHEVTVAVSNWDLSNKLDVDTTVDHWVSGVRVRYFNMRERWLTRMKVPGFRYSTARVAGPDWTQWITDNIASFDVIDLQIGFLSFSPLAARLARKHGKVLFYHQRGVLDPLRLQLKKWRKLFYIETVEKKVLRAASVLIALTEYEAESFRKLGVNRPVCVIPNGVDAGYGQGEIKPTARADELIRSFGERPVFMWMSRIHETKGVDVFTEAFIIAAKRNSEIVGVLAGPDETGLESGLKKRIEAEGLSSRFHFTGALYGDDKLALLRRCDVFVFPTMTEGFSMVLLEALASHCAILTSPGAYFNEIADAGAGKILERTAPAYAGAMLELVENGGGQMRSFAANGGALVREHYTWDIVADQYAGLAQKELSTTARV